MISSSSIARTLSLNADTRSYFGGIMATCRFVQFPLVILKDFALGGLRIAPQDSGLFKDGRRCSWWLENWNGFEAGTGEAAQCPIASPPLGSAYSYLRARCQLSLNPLCHGHSWRGAGASCPTSEAGKGSYILPGMGVP